MKTTKNTRAKRLEDIIAKNKKLFILDPEMAEDGCIDVAVEVDWKKISRLAGWDYEIVDEAGVETGKIHKIQYRKKILCIDYGYPWFWAFQNGRSFYINDYDSDDIEYIDKTFWRAFKKVIGPDIRKVRKEIENNSI